MNPLLTHTFIAFYKQSPPKSSGSSGIPPKSDEECNEVESRRRQELNKEEEVKLRKGIKLEKLKRRSQQKEVKKKTENIARGLLLLETLGTAVEESKEIRVTENAEKLGDFLAREGIMKESSERREKLALLVVAATSYLVECKVSE
jgi:hypothetical protein